MLLNDNNDDSNGGGGIMLYGSSSHHDVLLPSPPAARRVILADLSSDWLTLLVGAIGVVALVAGVYVLLAAAQAKLRPRGGRSPNDMLVDRTTAKVGMSYKLEPLQDKLPMSVPTEITTTSLGGNASSSLFLPTPLSKESTSRPGPLKTLKSILLCNESHHCKPSVLLMDGSTTSCSSIGSSVA